MRSSTRAAATAAIAATANAASLSDLCTVSAVQAALPSNGTLNGIDLLPSTVTAAVVSNATGQAGIGSTIDSTATYNYCNVSLSYVWTGTDRETTVMYAFPDPSNFANRFYVGGGGGYTLNSGTTGGLAYGAVAGATNAGYGFGVGLDSYALNGNGSLNWDNIYSFGYQGLGEMTKIGKAITTNLYSTGSSKIYTYYEGCSDGGREGWSQIQRYGDEYDGAIVGAPAFRMANQQVNHLSSSVMEKTLGYYPPPCELEKIVNLTIAFCDPLDGRTDSVVSRTDLCKAQFDLNSTIGEAYYCAAENSTSLGFGFSKRQAAGSTTSYTPAQNGTVSAEAVAVAAQIWEGLFSSAGARAYFPWQIASSFGDAATEYDSDTGAWGVGIPSTGGEWVTKFLQELDIDNLSSLDNVTYDTLISWMNTGLMRFMDSLQTTYPDISTFNDAGGKIIHFHGESDNSIPPASSVHYYDAVRTTMYPSLGYNESVAALDSWYQFYLVPGAAHCGTNSLQPGAFPSANVEVMIDWVENGVTPSSLNATVSSGDFEGETQNLCKWPTRPMWSGNSSYSCEFSQDSINSWTFTLDAFKLPIW